MEMDDMKSPSNKNQEDEDSEDSGDDGVQFIAIKVTNPDGSSRSSPEPAKTKKTVRMMESPPKFEDNQHHDHFDHHPKVDSPFHEFGKVFFLVCIWAFMILFLASTPEKKVAKRQIVLHIDEPKVYSLPAQPTSTLVHITLQAPFLPDPREYTRRASNGSIDSRNKENTVVIFLRTQGPDSRQLTTNKTFYVHKPEEIDLVNASKLEFTFDMGEDNFDDLEEQDVVQAVILANFSNSPAHLKQEMPIIFSVDFTPINKPIGVLFAAFTLILLYALIVWEVSCGQLSIDEGRKFNFLFRWFIEPLRQSLPVLCRSLCWQPWTTDRHMKRLWDGLT